MFFIFLVLGFIAVVLGVIGIQNMSAPNLRLMPVTSATLLEIEILLAFVIAIICFTGADIMYILEQIVSGLDHGIGHIMFVEVDSEEQEVAPPISKSPQTSNAASDRKIAPPLLSRLAG